MPEKVRSTNEGLYVVGADQLSPVANLTIDDLPAVIGVKVASSCAIGDHVEVGMKATPELVESFNKEYRRIMNFFPKRSYKLENTTLTIEKWKEYFHRWCAFKCHQPGLIKGRVKSYLLPISIASVSDKNLSIIERFAYHIHCNQSNYYYSSCGYFY